MDILSLVGLVLAVCAILIGAVLKGAGLKALRGAIPRPEYGKYSRACNLSAPWTA